MLFESFFFLRFAATCLNFNTIWCSTNAPTRTWVCEYTDPQLALIGAQAGKEM